MARFLLVFALAASLAGLCHSRTAARRERFPAEEDILYLPKVSALKVMSLGHRELAASLVFIRALVYYGGEIATKDKRFTWLDNYLETIVELDPEFELAYRWAGTVTMYNGRTITNESVERSNHYLRMGVKRFPRSWQIPWMLGVNYLVELRTNDPKQKAEWQRIGADWIRQAALVGSAPPWAANLASQIMQKSGQDEAAIRYLEEVYLTTSDEKTRDEIRGRLMFLKKQLLVGQLEKSAQAFTGAWKRTLPYSHPDLFVILGEPPPARLDPDWLGRDELLVAAQQSEEAMRHERDDPPGPQVPADAPEPIAPIAPPPARDR